MGLIFDTSVIISVERGRTDLDALAKGRENEAFAITAVTAAELLHGVHRAASEKRRLIREAFVEKILETFGVIPFDVAAARAYARLWALLSSPGRRIGAHDLMIAATVISRGFTLITSDERDYQRIEGLSLEIHLPNSSSPP